MLNRALSVFESVKRDYPALPCFDFTRSAQFLIDQSDAIWDDPSPIVWPFEQFAAGLGRAWGKDFVEIALVVDLAKKTCIYYHSYLNASGPQTPLLNNAREDMAKIDAEGAQDIIVVGFKALSTIKNVQTVDVEPRRTRAERRRGDPTISYKVLDIKIAGQQRRTNMSYGPYEPDARIMPLHLVRTYMATYTQEKPLFGKYPGTFLIPAHARGDASRGIIEKDYRVTP